MTDSQKIKKEKDIHISKVVEQYADTKDPFVNQIYKKLRNKKKKLDKIKETEQKVKKGELQPNQEQKDMINSKSGLLEEMKELDGIIQMYKEAFPENPVWTQIAAPKDKKAKKGAAQEQIQQQQPVAQQQIVQQEPQVDVSQIIQDALSLIADAIVARTLVTRFNEALPGSSKQHTDSLDFLFQSFEKLAGYGGQHGEFQWGQAKEQFVDNFSRLALKSQTQVGQHTSKSYADIHNFLKELVSNESLLQKQFSLKKETHEPKHKPAAEQHITRQSPEKKQPKQQEEIAGTQQQEETHDTQHDQEPYNEDEEVKGGVEEGLPEGEQLEGTEGQDRPRTEGGYERRGRGTRGGYRGGYRGARGNRGGRGGRGGYQQREDVDDDGFQVVKERQDQPKRGRGGRGSRGGYRGRGEGGDRRGRGRGDFQGQHDQPAQEQTTQGQE